MCICYEVSNQQITLKTVEAFANKLYNSSGYRCLISSDYRIKLPLETMMKISGT